MLFGQTFRAYEAVVERHAKYVKELRRQLPIVPLGETAVGTGLNSRPGYKSAVLRHLSALAGHEIKPAADPFNGMQNLDACARLSAEIRNCKFPGRSLTTSNWRGLSKQRRSNGKRRINKLRNVQSVSATSSAFWWRRALLLGIADTT